MKKEARPFSLSAYEMRAIAYWLGKSSGYGPDGWVKWIHSQLKAKHYKTALKVKL